MPIVIYVKSFLTDFERYLTIVTHIFELFASGIAIYLFLFQRKTISSAFRALLSYSRQLTLTELLSKLDRLNELNADIEAQNQSVINILSEIRGQIRGNNKLKTQFLDILKEIEPYCLEKTKLKETAKRSIVYQIRELIRSYDVDLKNN